MHLDYDYLIVGGGMVANAAARGIREHDRRGRIGILGEEPTGPTSRPALSRALWADPDLDLDEEDLGTARATGATVHLNTRVVHLDVEQKCVTSEDGHTFGYGRLLIATGGHPREVAGLPASDRVLYYRSVADYQRLRALAVGGAVVAAVGGGPVSTEIAAALRDRHCQVTILHPSGVLNDRVFPAELATTFEGLFLDAGVHVRGGVTVVGGRQDGARVRLDLSDGASVDVDVAVLGLGIEPASELARGTLALSSDGGVVVDERLATSAPDVYAAGDVADYPDRILGRTRVEHVDGAETMGATAGRVMAGSTETYDHTPLVYSDVLDHGYEAVGTLDSTMETVLDPVDEDALVVYYLDEEQVRGVLLWDTEGGTDAARDLLARHSRPADPSDLVGSVR